MEFSAPFPLVRNMWNLQVLRFQRKYFFARLSPCVISFWVGGVEDEGWHGMRWFLVCNFPIGGFVLEYSELHVQAMQYSSCWPHPPRLAPTGFANKGF